ncbi:MCE family protein [Rhodococcus tukisamuensis]|uniref:Phospholipid/cholesterol/gamma-HCH transport system substrate-binding protein n=1 Tax=Rhodococcus tukisamuensis TaxID=168276 RepID=A0A1G6RC60_9NOCA|nr:MCE family protein [Rhodococcus tukisamuensis]SDD01496.1 phospholipid/cholesterol/gamma-HCH transport system substrate-binding protein [Rhodococcus tukisamuensis]
MTVRRRGIGVAAAVAALVLSGCQWSGLNSVPLPGAAGRGEGSFSVVIEMPDVTTISPNSPVLVGDVTVGSISAIETDGWHAKVTVSLDESVRLPANATAKIGQTSLLGSKHVALAPPTDVVPAGQLAEGSVIPLASAGVYPTTEEALTALSVVLNGGGLAQVQSITTELNEAMDGRTDAARDLLSQLDSLTELLDRQREAMVTTMTNLDGFAGEVNAQRDVLGRALDTLDPAMAELAAQRTDLTAALDSVGRFGDVGTDLVNRTRDDLKANLTALEPTLQQVVAAGSDLIDNLGNLSTFPFPQTTIDDGMRGDYTNLWALIDLTTPRLRSGLGFGTPLGEPPATAAGAAPIDPLTAPLRAVGRAATSPESAPETTPEAKPEKEGSGR